MPLKLEMKNRGVGVLEWWQVHFFWMLVWFIPSGSKVHSKNQFRCRYANM